ncbi:MAG TPA: VWA domain-containing protein, partial [Acidimicrobiales bacterium]|nr:VWA domain-containing protein [Acidimicrobiales bacterium]
MRRSRLVGALAAVLVAVGLLVAPVVAQEGDTVATALRIQQVDSTNPAATEMVVAWAGSAAALESADITVNGESAEPSSVAPLAGADTGLVLVIDNSAAMEEGGALQRARESLAELVQNRPEGQLVSVISVGGSRARNVQSWTTDTAKVLDVIAALGPDGDSALWRGDNSAAGLLDVRPDLIGQVVVFAGGEDQSATRVSLARGAIAATGASVHAIVVEDRGLDAGSVRSLVDTAG